MSERAVTIVSRQRLRDHAVAVGARPGVDVAALLQEQAGLYTSPGPDYGGPPDWVRLNFATSTSLLDDMISRMAQALPARAR